MKLQETLGTIRRSFKRSALFHEASAFVVAAKVTANARAAESELRAYHDKSSNGQTQTGTLDKEYILAVQTELAQLKQRAQKLLAEIATLSEEEQVPFQQFELPAALSHLVDELTALLSFPDAPDSAPGSAPAPGSEEAETIPVQTNQPDQSDEPQADSAAQEEPQADS